MDARRFVPTLLLVVLAAAVGALLAEVLRAPDGDAEGEVLQRQAERIEELTLEVRRLKAETQVPQMPALSGRSEVAPTGEAGTRSDVALRETATPPPTPAATPSTPPPPAVWPAGGMLDVIKRFAASEVRQTDTALVGNGETMATLFQATAEGPTVRAEETKPDAELAPGTTIVLDAGVYDFSAFSGAHRGTFPADVTFRGVGMDRTLLILHEVSSTGEARNLGFEDLTLDTRGHYLADVRGDEPISLRFDRARVIGWDQKPGGAVLLAARFGAVLARDSRFEGGFGNAPGEGSFFHVRGPLLVRFERCTLVGPFLSLYEKSDKASYAWTACRFEQLPEARRRDVVSPDANLRFENCSFEYLEAGVSPPARSRAELDPSWR